MVFIDFLVAVYPYSQNYQAMILFVEYKSLPQADTKHRIVPRKFNLKQIFDRKRSLETKVSNGKIVSSFFVIRKSSHGRSKGRLLLR